MKLIIHQVGLIEYLFGGQDQVIDLPNNCKVEYHQQEY